MDNELIVEKSWWNKNWKWFLPSSIFLIVLGFLLSSTVDGNITDIVQAYSDDLLYKEAIQKAQTNEKVIALLGKIEPIDKLAILEGDAVYTNNNKSVVLSIRIKGSKGKGKMDILANKSGTKWHYKNIKIRVKEPKEEIQILKDSVEVKQ